MTGCFAAKLWSSDWKPGSTKSKQKTRSKKKIKSCSGRYQNTYLSVALSYIFQILVIGMPIIIGPTLLVSTTGFIVNSHVIIGSVSSSNVLYGNSVTRPVVVTNTT